MDTSLVQSVKLALVEAIGLSKDALHVYVGLGTYLIVAVAFRRPLGSLLPLAVVFTVAVLGEILDWRDDVATLGRWRWKASLHDVVNTTLWPLALYVLARTGAIRPRSPSGER